MSELTTPDDAVSSADNADAGGSAPLTDEEHAALAAQSMALAHLRAVVFTLARAREQLEPAVVAAHEAWCSNRVIADEVGVSPTTIASMVKAAS